MNSLWIAGEKHFRKLRLVSLANCLINLPRIISFFAPWAVPAFLDAPSAGQQESLNTGDILTFSGQIMSGQIPEC